MGEHDFSVDTLERLRRSRNAGHVAKIEEYVYTPQVDPGPFLAQRIGLRTEGGPCALRCTQAPLERSQFNGVATITGFEFQVA